MAARRKSNQGNAQSSSRSGRGGSRGQRVIAAQREINQDYKNLVDDYGTLFARLWRIPSTKYVLGGVAIVTLVPFAIKALRRIPEVDHFFDENMSAMHEKIEQLEEFISNKFSHEENPTNEVESRH